jgi:hypothetical protein
MGPKGIGWQAWTRMSSLSVTIARLQGEIAILGICEKLKHVCHVKPASYPKPSLSMTAYADAPCRPQLSKNQKA